MPPAVILAVGCLNKFANCSGDTFALIPTRAGAAAVPTPPSPWHALHDEDSKMVLPLAASGSANAVFAAVNELEESSASNGLCMYSCSSDFCLASCCATPGSWLSTYWLRSASPNSTSNTKEIG